MDLTKVKTREAAVELLDGASEATLESLSAGVSRRPLVKTYMFEHGGGREFLARNFLRAGITLEALDDDFYKVRDSGSSDYRGFIELLRDRHPVLYTTERVDDADRWVRHAVKRNETLDRLWISGPMFERLWNRIAATTHRSRFGKIVFQHENPFDLTGSTTAYDDSDDESDTRSAERDPTDAPAERKATRFAVVDRIGELSDTLPKMRALYAPLYSIAQLRLPGNISGGHDFYFDGKVTNRTNSFTEHRLKVSYVLDVYRNATTRTEEAAWTGVREMQVGSDTAAIWRLGAPVKLEFKNPLREDVFDRFVEAVFVRHQHQFGLWGNPIRLGATKVHVYALDRHVAQQIFLEITAESILAILPYGTCGNTVHRLVTNVQQLLDPAVTVWIGDALYESIIETDPRLIGDSDA